MTATIVNTFTVLAGSLLGILLRNQLKSELQTAVIKALGLCTILIGISSAVKTEDLLCVILSMAFGTVLGEWIGIDNRIELAGDALKRKFVKSDSANSRFTEGFVSACILFCIGSMTIMGCLEAGINRNYSIIFAKSTLDFFSSMAFGAAMGIGVTFSAVFVLVFQGALTLLASWIGPVLSPAVVNEMSAVGGVMLVGLAFNLLGITKDQDRIKVANMLPAIFLPLLYFLIRSFFS